MQIGKLEARLVWSSSFGKQKKATKRKRPKATKRQKATKRKRQKATKSKAKIETGIHKESGKTRVLAHLMSAHLRTS